MRQVTLYFYYTQEYVSMPQKNNIRKFVHDHYTVNDLDTIIDSFKDTELLEEEMDSCWEESATISASSSEYEEYKQEAMLLLKKLKKKDRQIRFLPLFRYAAAIIILLVAGITLWTKIPATDNNEQAVVYSEIYVPNGERETLLLPDGSRITLNSGSYVRYPSQFTGDTRMIEIDGEAFLKVQPDSLKRFIVRTEQLDVTVLGTSFNVKAYKTDPSITVSVRTGKVQVDMEDAKMSVQPDEMVTLNKVNGEIEKRTIDSKKTVAWMTGGLYFDKTPVSVVAQELERYYDCSIQIENEDLKQELVYGEHSNENLESVLKALEYAIGIKNKKEGDRIILYK